MAIKRLEIPNKSGIYTLIIFVARPVRTVIGKLGSQVFPAGLYTYTGSAIGRSTGLKIRISRHLAFHKKHHWHIDYLLASRAIKVKAVVFAETSQKMECQVVTEIKQLIGVRSLVKGFGASDCHYGCLTHLHYFSTLDFEQLLSQIIKVYTQMFSRTPPTDGRILITGRETKNVGWIFTTSSWHV